MEIHFTAECGLGAQIGYVLSAGGVVISPVKQPVTDRLALRVQVSGWSHAPVGLKGSSTEEPLQYYCSVQSVVICSVLLHGEERATNDGRIIYDL